MAKSVLLASPHMSDEGYELEYINDAFRKNWIAPLGENVNEFEKAVGSFLGEGYPVALSAGTAALHLAMILAGVGAGLYKSVPEACRAMIKRNPAQDPIAENVPQYAKVYEVYKKLYQANKELFKDLAAL